MKISKKILIPIIIIIISVLVLLLVMLNMNRDEKNNQTTVSENEVFFEKNSFTEREDIIKDILSKKLSVSFEKSSVMIARETPGYINGVFSSEELTDKNQNKVYFYAITSGNNVEVVWYGDTDPDCSIMQKYNFPNEMKDNCK